MKRLSILALLLAVASGLWPEAFAQMNFLRLAAAKKKQAADAAPTDWPPTGFANFWDPSGSGWVTNAGVYTLVDQVGGQNLTNTSASTAPLVGPSLNGYRTLSFANHRLQNDAVTATNANSFAVIWVTVNTNKGAASYICVGTNSEVAILANAAVLQASAGSAVNVFNPMTTNSWVVRCQIFKSSMSYGWENLTKSGNVNPGSGDLLGLIWGQNAAGSFASLQHVAMIGLITPAPSANDWTNSIGLYQTIKTHYGL